MDESRQHVSNSTVGMLSNEDSQLLRSFFQGLRHPVDIMDDYLQATGQKGQRAGDTCEWVSSREEYLSWLSSRDSALLWLNGGPGTGKTMIATYLADQLVQHVKKSHTKMLLAFYIFRPRADTTHSAAADLARSLIVQLCQQDPALLDHLKGFEVSKLNGLRTSFRTLWQILERMLSTPGISTLLLIDGLEECDANSRIELSNSIAGLFADGSLYFCKCVVLSRPEIWIREAFGDHGKTISVNTTTIAPDLLAYIDSSVLGAQTNQDFSTDAAAAVRQQLIDRNGGTFLWVSLALEEISNTIDFVEMQEVLANLPLDLYGIYDRVLRRIDREQRPTAVTLLRAVAAKSLEGQPWTRDDLAAVCFIDPCNPSVTPRYPSMKEVDDYRGCHEILGNLLRVRTVPHRGDLEIVEFVHPSFMGYLASEHLRLHPELSEFYFDSIQSQLDMYRLHRIILACSGRDFPALNRTEWDNHLLLAGDLFTDKYMRLFWKCFPENVCISYIGGLRIHLSGRLPRGSGPLTSPLTRPRATLLFPSQMPKSENEAETRILAEVAEIDAWFNVENVGREVPIFHWMKKPNKRENGDEDKSKSPISEGMKEYHQVVRADQFNDPQAVERPRKFYPANSPWIHV